MQKRYPFPFLDAYEREDRDFFFGREEEIEQLYQLTQQSNIVLLYGHSGAGKTSLIRCGLSNKFKSYDWQDVYVRRGGHLIHSLDKALCEEADHHYDLTASDGTAITDLAKKLEAVYKTSFKPLYLIFDQFEELYTLGSKDEQEAFISTVREILRVEQPVKIIFSIREEYLGHLYEFERAVPELTRKKLRVEPMNLERVKAVLLGVSNQPHSNVQLEAGHEAAIAEGIFNKIRGEDKILYIPLPYLQVFLDKFYVSVTKDESRQAEVVFTRENLSAMGDLGDVLRNFLDEQATAISRAQGLPEAQVWRALSPFVTLDGTKDPLSEAQLIDHLSDLPAGTPARLLQALVQGRILRFSEANQLYEIAHDALAKQINDKRSDEEIAKLEVQRLVKSQTAMNEDAREYFTEKQLLFMEPYLEKLVLREGDRAWIEESRVWVQQQKEEAQRKQEQELEETRKRLRVVRGLLALAGLALVLAGFFWYNAYEQKKVANNKTEEAILARDSTGLALTLAEEEKQKAIKAREEADESARLANIEEQKAIEAQKDAEGERNKVVQTLEELRLANEATVDLLLKDANTLILNLRYEEAEEKIASAERLDALKKDVSQAYMELVFWYGETGDEAKAGELLKKAWALQNRTLPTNLSMRESLMKLDSIEYDTLMKRYYPDMVPIQGGKFMMGCDTSYDNNCRSDEKQVPRTVSDFQIARYETTVWQFALFCKAKELNISEYLVANWIDPGNNPVVNVSWFEAVAYANWVSERMGLARIIDEDEYKLLQRNGGYRLPSEAEWEYAARAGQKTVYAGSNDLDSVGWYSGNSRGRTEAVGWLKKRNDFGLYDMSGNVWEWCWDWYGDYSEESLTDYFGPDGASYRVYRGGGWGGGAGGCRAAGRGGWYPADRDGDLGFRLALSLEAG